MIHTTEIIVVKTLQYSLSITSQTIQAIIYPFTPLVFALLFFRRKRIGVPR